MYYAPAGNAPPVPMFEVMGPGADQTSVRAPRFLDEHSAGVQRLLSQFRPRLAEPRAGRVSELLSLMPLTTSVPLSGDTVAPPDNVHGAVPETNAPPGTGV